MREPRTRRIRILIKLGKELYSKLVYGELEQEGDCRSADRSAAHRRILLSCFSFVLSVAFCCLDQHKSTKTGQKRSDDYDMNES